MYLPRRGLRGAVGVKDRVVAKIVRLLGHSDGIKIIGRVEVAHLDRFGKLLSVDHGHNEVVTAGLNELVDSMVASTNFINGFTYIAPGTTSTATVASNTALLAEVSGGSYARLLASQAEGSQTYIYQLGQSTWTNASGSSQNIKEHGIFTSTTAGIMFSRISLADPDGIAAKNVGPSEQLQYTWTVTFADA